MTKPLTCFLKNKEHLPASNFYLDGGRLQCATNEHFYQAFKTTDPEWRRRILTAPSPGKSKHLGGKCPLRPDWEQIKISVMRFGLTEKFYVGGPMATWLLGTADALLVEGNWWHDNTWGVCWCDDCYGRDGFDKFVRVAQHQMDMGATWPVIDSPNLLGKLLMERRLILRSMK